MDVILIAAITQDGFIARHSHETVRWSRDLHIFKKQTQGWPVIMGSHTFDCLQKELDSREIYIVHRGDEPEKILEKYKKEKCFVAGGGKINSRFSPYLTHLYLTPHPRVFGRGIRLFADPIEALDLIFDQMIAVEEKKGLFQFQYRVNRDIHHSV
ncbi:MAG: dihydrofolate reductase [Candidatus Marinimicrobia bacterium]|nr:dihydrofolate reductase [Candidatus Neomarinimicrobiota bacterium]